MIHREEIISDKRLIIVIIEGNFDMETMNKLAIHYRKMALNLGYKLICDLRNGKSMITIVEALRAVRKYEREELRELSKVPVCVIAEGMQYAFFKVVEQFVNNSRGELKVFRDLEPAISYFEAKDYKKE